MTDNQKPVTTCGMTLLQVMSIVGILGLALTAGYQYFF